MTLLYPIGTVNGIKTAVDDAIVFHGINKSGSLALAATLRDAYFADTRASQFFSHYHKTPALLSDLLEIFGASRGHAFFVAHYLYGALPKTGRRFHYVTQFRHPLPRLLSCYQWQLNKDAHRGVQPRFSSIAEFVKKCGGKANSQIVQFGLGYGPDSTERTARHTVRELFERSIEALERDVALIGVAEHFEETLFLFAKLCGLEKIPAWKRDERNPGRPLASTVSESDKAMIEDVFRYDFELYRWALDRFAGQVARASFGQELQTYKSVCINEYKDRIV